MIKRHFVERCPTVLGHFGLSVFGGELLSAVSEFGWLARTLQSAVHVWSKSAAKKASSSLILQPGLLQDDGKTRTRSTSETAATSGCLSERNESKVTNARRKTMIEHNGLSRHAVGRFQSQIISSK